MKRSHEKKKRAVDWREPPSAGWWMGNRVIHIAWENHWMQYNFLFVRMKIWPLDKAIDDRV